MRSVAFGICVFGVLFCLSKMLTVPPFEAFGYCWGGLGWIAVSVLVVVTAYEDDEDSDNELY